jgi:hypothetical protein
LARYDRRGAPQAGADREDPADTLAEIEDFVDFLRQRQEERRLTNAVTCASEAAFAKVWGKPDDAEYDRI